MLLQFSGPIVEVMDIDGDAIDMAVGVSMSKAGVLIAGHLVNSGYKRVAYVGAWGERPKRSLLRRIAFDRELERLGIPLVASVILEEASFLASGANGLRQLLAQDLDFDTVFFANDDLALGALFYCQANGISVPEDIALAGYNGLEMCQSIAPRLTTISTPRYEMGRLAGELATGKLNSATGPQKNKLKLDLNLIKGGTT